MKKVVKAKKRAPNKARGAQAARGGVRSTASRRTGRSSTSRKFTAKASAIRATAKALKRPSKPAAGLAARVLSRRAAANAAKLAAPTKLATPTKPATAAIAPRSSAATVPAPAVRAHKVHPAQRPRAGRPAPPAYRPNRELMRASRVPQFTYMKAPGSESAFNVGDPVEVFCDHELNSERVRGWVKGVVVQVDNKLVAVQFRSNVFLTDGWMVPDRILWYSLSSDQIRALGLGKKAARKAIPEY